MDTVHYYPAKYRENKSKRVYCGRKISWGMIGNNGAKFASDKPENVTCKLCLNQINKNAGA